MIRWLLFRLGYARLNTVNKHVYQKASSYLEINFTYLINDMLRTCIRTDETMREIADNIL